MSIPIKRVAVLAAAFMALALLGCSHHKAPAPTPAPSANAGAAAQPGVAGPASGAAVPAHPDLVMLAGTVFDGCKAPTSPTDPPDGAVATRAQMIAAHTLTANFNTATNFYLACLDTAARNFNQQYGRALTVSALRDVVAMHDRVHNAAVDADTAVANKFNLQLRTYKARGGTP
jgi:hypothetical protein